jgi:hypothetical protein
MYVYRKDFVFLHERMSASVGNTINHALPRLHDIEAISRDTQVRFEFGLSRLSLRL